MLRIDGITFCSKTDIFAILCANDDLNDYDQSMAAKNKLSSACRAAKAARLIMVAYWKKYPSQNGTIPFIFLYPKEHLATHYVVLNNHANCVQQAIEQIEKHLDLNGPM